MPCRAALHHLSSSGEAGTTLSSAFAARLDSLPLAVNRGAFGGAAAACDTSGRGIDGTVAGTAVLTIFGTPTVVQPTLLLPAAVCAHVSYY